MCILTLLGALGLISLVGWAMRHHSRYSDALQAVGDKGVNDTPLYSRFHYRREDVITFWGAMGSELERERNYLRWDLWFPVIYIIILGSAAGFMHYRSHGLLPIWLWLLPVVVAACADWTENIVLLNQIDAFMRDPDLVSAQRIKIASIATTLKIFFFVLAVAVIPIACTSSLHKLEAIAIVAGLLIVIAIAYGFVLREKARPA